MGRDRGLSLRTLFHPGSNAGWLDHGQLHLALVVIIFMMPSVYGKKRRATIDYLGYALIALAIMPVLLGLTWADSTYPWLSWQVLGLLVDDIAVLGLFVLYEVWLERHNRQPIFEPSLFKSSIFSVSSLVTVFFGMRLFGSTSLYVKVGLGPLDQGPARKCLAL